MSDQSPPLQRQAFFDELRENFISTLEGHKIPHPYDVMVSIDIRGPGKQSKFSVDMTSFFLRYKEATFHKVVFAEPIGRKMERESLIKGPAAAFDSELFSKPMIIKRSKTTNEILINSSRPHAIQLFYMFKMKIPNKVGEKADLFLKLTGIVPDEGRGKLKICAMTVFTPVKTSGKTPPTPTKRKK